MAHIITLKQLCTEMKPDRARPANACALQPATPKSTQSWRSCTSLVPHGADLVKAAEASRLEV